ncbi:MAG TPA: hypothetical protein P5519_06800 [Spirochaetia bacterium]|nr:hypothetical protein [Spirochaetales bacterium]HPD81351.1 hypothetical protein [Spirochaetales bacterium]HRS65580.1 hypothetical protein [Spirochaetia bacterium]HRV27749.1 hypothetical protein [Spirochaetia bacterium]
MGKATQESRNKYMLKVQEYKKIIDELSAKEQSMVAILKQGNPITVGHGYFKLANAALDITSYYILLNTLSVALIGIKNEDALADARKAVGRSIKYIEDIVTPYIDVPFSEYEKNLEAIADISYEDRYNLFRKIGFAIAEIETGYGTLSKWKWSFVELWGKHAVITRNLLDLKKAYTDMDFSSPNREIVLSYIDYIKKLFQQAADKYREKYEIFSNKIEDFKSAIVFLSGLRRFYITMGEKDEADELKKKIEVWNNKLNADQKKMEEDRKK